MNVLFVCNQNLNRSKKAEHIFKGKVSTKSAGLFNELPLTSENLDWADLVVVMEEMQRKEIAKRFPKQYLKKKIISLDIPDIYLYDDLELESLLREKVASNLSIP